MILCKFGRERKSGEMREKLARELKFARGEFEWENYNYTREQSEIILVQILPCSAHEIREDLQLAIVAPRDRKLHERLSQLIQ